MENDKRNRQQRVFCKSATSRMIAGGQLSPTIGW